MFRISNAALVRGFLVSAGGALLCALLAWVLALANMPQGVHFAVGASCLFAGLGVPFLAALVWPHL